MNNSDVCVFGCMSGWEDWISTGLYLSPGMKTYVAFPVEIVNKGWKVFIVLALPLAVVIHYLFIYLTL